MKRTSQILEIVGIIFLGVILGFLLFKIYFLENQEPEIVYVNHTFNYSDEELREDFSIRIANLKEVISNLEEQLNETNLTLQELAHLLNEKSKDSGPIIIANENIEIDFIESASLLKIE